ncbi:MAG: hypothetical protein ACK40G_02880 [Cytophagaceae bacterium]
MKNILSFILTFVIFSAVAFAQTNVKPAASSEGTLKKHSIEIQKVIKTEKGVIRGYDFGTSEEEIRKTEDAKLEADGRNFLIYKVEIDKNEYAEIIYYLDANKKVSGFGIAFIETLGLKAEESLIDDFQSYFNERYGKFTVNEKNDEVWTSKDGSYFIEMGDSSEGGDLIEIEIEFYQKKK